MIGLHEGKGSKVRAKKPAERTLLLRLQVVACEPPVWRRCARMWSDVPA